MAEEVYKNPSFSKRILELTGLNDVRRTLVQNESAVKSKAQENLSMSSKDDITMKHERICH